MGSFNSKDPDQQSNHQRQARKSFTEYSDFPKYYQYMRKCLKLKQFKLGNPQDPVSFKQRLATMNGINKKVAKMWISFYIDYMILATWSYCLGTKYILYPPYAIQQVARLHTCYRNNYINFITIITENRKQAFYFPQRLIAQQDSSEDFFLRYSYTWAKDFLSDLYENSKVHKADKKKMYMDKIWEDFDITLLQSEFSFSFSKLRDKAEFQRIIMENSNLVTLKNLEPNEIFRVAKNIRTMFNLGEILSNSQEFQIPKLLIEDFKIIRSVDKAQEELINSINNLEFSRTFVNLLAWEQRITIEEALLRIREYKRFLFLSLGQAGKDHISPSESVNQVWRFHMQFSPVYEASMSKIKILNSECRHKKSQKQDKNEDTYEKTLAAYHHYFGTPDVYIWPCPEVNSMHIRCWASYCIYFARECMTDDQRAKLLEKYIEYKALDNKKTSEKGKQQKKDENGNNYNQCSNENPNDSSFDFDMFLLIYMNDSNAENYNPQKKDNSEIYIDEEPVFQGHNYKNFADTSSLGLVNDNQIANQEQSLINNPKKQGDSTWDCICFDCDCFCCDFGSSSHHHHDHHSHHFCCFGGDCISFDCCSGDCCNCACDGCDCNCACDGCHCDCNCD